MTIAEYFGNSLEKFDRRAFDYLSNGMLEFVHLRHSQEAGQILKCARAVVARLGSLPFAGKVTLAKVMADSMAELHATKEMSAPKAWYPIIKRLRFEHQLEQQRGKAHILHAPGWRAERF